VNEAKGKQLNRLIDVVRSVLVSQKIRIGVISLCDCHLSGCPVSRGAHIDPVAVQLKTNLGVPLGHNERFQWSRDGKIQPAIYLLHGLIKLNRVGRASFPVQQS
jgi:hypothetical protein